MTDANVVLGRIDPQRFLGGRLPLDSGGARKAVGILADTLGVGLRRTAQSIVRMANAHMERALRVISTQRGHDPRDFTLVSFGGAGGLHACDLAAALGIPRVLVPRNPGVLSALGALCSDVERHAGRTVMQPGDRAAAAALRPDFRRLQQQLRQAIRRDVPRGGKVQFIQSVDMRYCGQSFEINVPFYGSWDRTARAFHSAHTRQYGHADPRAQIEIVTIRVLARLAAPTLRFRRLPRGGRLPPSAVLGKRGTTTVYDREALRAGNRVRGPGLITEPFASAWVPRGWAARVDDWGHLILEPD